MGNPAQLLPNKPKNGLSLVPVQTRYEGAEGNLYTSLCEAAALWPGKTAICDDARKVTFGEFLGEVDSFALWLQERYGVGPGDAVAVMMTSCIEFLQAFYAICRLGGVCVAINSKQQGPGVLHCLRESGARLLILQARYREKVAGILEEAALDAVLVVGGEAPCPFPPELKGAQTLDVAGVKAPLPRPEDTALVCFTSGTTGKAKGACITHGNILSTAYGYRQVQGLTPQDTTVLAVPVFHILGISCVSTMVLSLGATLVLQSRFLPEETMEKIREYKATHFHAAPTVFTRLGHAFNPQKHDLTSLRIAVCGGAHIPQADIEAFCRAAPKASFRLAYGMTETAGNGLLGYGHRQPAAPVPNVGFMVADENQKPVPLGQPGEILMCGPAVIPGYCKGRSPESFAGGWLRSGDMGRMDAQGHIEILYRIKELINRGGEKLSPVAVENAILSLPGTRQAVVCGLPDEIYGEVPAAVVTLDTPGSQTPHSIRRGLKHKLARYEIPVLVEIWDAIPTTASGKVSRHMIAQRLLPVYKRQLKGAAPLERF